jgi:hypothetical protein
MANHWAARNDLVVFIGEGATEGHAPALFRPDIAEIEIDIEKAFGFGVKPETIGDLERAATRYEFPRAVGAIYHEACHARYSQWDMRTASEALEKDDGVYLSFELPEINPTQPVNAKRLGETLVSQSAFENPDGTPVTLAIDYFGKPRDPANPGAGPFAGLKPGRHEIKVWPK